MLEIIVSPLFYLLQLLQIMETVSLGHGYISVGIGTASLWLYNAYGCIITIAAIPLSGN